MLTTRITPQVGALVFVLALVLPACGGGASSVAPSPSGVAPTDSPSPSPTEAPLDIAEAFTEKANGLLTFNSELSGTIQVANVKGEVSGELQIRGRDTHNLIVITFPGLPVQEVESITAGGTTYERSDQGYWLRSAGAAGGAAGTDPVSAALADADGLEVVGTEEHGGATLHRIESSRPAEIGPELLGMTDPTITDFEGQVAFLAEDDGTPAGIIVTAAWVQGPEEAPVPAEFELRFMIVDRDVTIEMPEDVWDRHSSAELGYRVDFPANWDVTHEPAANEFTAYDLYLSPVDEEVQVYQYTDLGGLTANAWFRDSAVVLAESYGAEPELANMLMLDNGLEGQIFIGHYTEGADKIFYQQAVMVAGKVAWDLNWYSDAGNEVEDQVQFLQLVMSFEPAP